MAKDTATEKPGLRPLVRNPEQMDAIMAQLKERGVDLNEIKIDRLDTLIQSGDRRLQALKDIDPKLNGQLAQAVKELQSYQKERTRERSFLEKIPVVGRPMNFAWEKMKAHPYITSGVILLILAILAMKFTPLGALLAAKAKDWLLPHLGKLKGMMSGLGEKFGKAWQGARGILDNARGKMFPMPRPQPVPVTPSVPSVVPSPEEALNILRKLEGQY